MRGIQQTICTQLKLLSRIPFNTKSWKSNKPFFQIPSLRSLLPKNKSTYLSKTPRISTNRASRTQARESRPHSKFEFPRRGTHKDNTCLSHSIYTMRIAVVVVSGDTHIPSREANQYCARLPLARRSRTRKAKREREVGSTIVCLQVRAHWVIGRALVCKQVVRLFEWW